MKKDLIHELIKLIEPIVLDLNYELYHLEYLKEQNENYLRVYIDSQNGISLEDCEKVSRKLSDILDEEDPIPDAYYLEVSSPGIEKVLYNDKHFGDNIGNEVNIKLSKPFMGNKKYDGKLLSFNDLHLSIQSEGINLDIPREKIKVITLKGEF